MAQFDTNFSGYSAGSPPTGWTARWVTTNVTNNVVSDAIGDGGQILRSTSTADARRLLSWDTVDADANRADVEILCRFRASSVTTGSTDSLRMHVRASGAAAAETGYHLTIPSASGANYTVNKYVSGSATALATVAMDVSANTLYNIRFRVNGTTIRAKVWKDGQAEPTDWQVDTTDSSVSSAGWVGVGRFESTPTLDITHFVAATNGDTATWPVAVDTFAIATQVASEVASAIDPSMYATQVALEVMSANSLNMIVTQVALETLTPQTQDMYVTQVALEVLSGDPWPSLSNANKYRQIQIAC